MVQNSFTKKEFGSLVKKIKKILPQQVAIKVGNHVRVKYNKSGSMHLFQVLDRWFSSGRLLVLKLIVEKEGDIFIIKGAIIEIHRDNDHPNNIFDQKFDEAITASFKEIIPTVITFDRPSRK